jgi:hypothetical protein
MTKEVMKQEHDEPYGYFRYDIRLDAWVQSHDNNKGVAFYTKPQAKEWVGLTKMELIKCGVLPFGMSYELYQAIEDKLKEKNEYY